MTEEEIADKVLFRMEGKRSIIVDCYEVEYYEIKGDSETTKNYVGVIRGGYQSWMDNTEDYYDEVHYMLDSEEELKSLKIGKSFTCDSDWDILVNINYNISDTLVFNYTYEDIYDEDSN